MDRIPTPGRRRARPGARDPRRALAPALAALALFCAVPSSARAGQALDIRPPDGFAVRRSTPEGADDTGYEVESASDAAVGCQVNLTGQRAPRGGDQAALNAEASAPGYLDHARADLAGLFEVRDVAPFSMQGARGSVATADPRVAAGALRAAVFDLDLPSGNLEVLCASSTDEFDAWRPLFEAVARGVTLPR